MSNVLRLYNTLAGRKEEFTPITPGEVRMYHCGPTVHNYAHIGNLRAYVFADILRRTLEWSGYEVRQVMNITDVGHLTSDADAGEDKMVKALKREGKPMTLAGMREVADTYTEAFRQDLTALNIKPPHEMPRASEHIREDIEVIQELERKGVAYKTSDGIYFDISKFPSYGTRGGFALGDLREGARVEVNTEKKNPRDFALWKFARLGLPAFESPFGAGFPGWHLECSAMSRKYLGQPFDIHTGGIDNISTHHQNEIAQSETAYGAPLARFWLHSEHLVVPSGKMAKSGENFITLKTLTDRGIHPLAYRYYLLGAHYKTPIGFSVVAVEAAQHSYYKLLRAFLACAKVEKTEPAARIDPYPSPFHETVDDDLNAPGVLALLSQILKDQTRSASEKYALLL
ncbi:MAG: cysteinyl-tRNA synthetase, partial [Parcubacteria group bacterium Greene0416_79]